MMPRGGEIRLVSLDRQDGRYPIKEAFRIQRQEPSTWWP
jgi:hypothetical protein